MTNPLAALSDSGVSIWLDDLSRERLASGSLADLADRDHVVGVTTNPAIFAKAITGSDAYHAQVPAATLIVRKYVTSPRGASMSGRRCAR